MLVGATSMNTDQDQAKSIFLNAAEIASLTERAMYLDTACKGSDALRREVEELLKHYGPAKEFLEPAVTAPGEVSTECAGKTIGPYKLLEQIGEGGMGTVWMAQQTEPVKRLVALKLIKAGMDSKQVIARFEAERQALALMDHANIARVLDAGTSSGRPYFVMDLVKGVPITKYCDEHHLTPQQRLELFIPVCQAVQHAHQKGIIHRDLKPSNVLVALYDGKPVPKVIDFGVAKAAGQSLTDKTLVTGFGNLVGTLEYMSPEQAEINQLDIDTRSDIYSLGVLLYELLTGSPPFSRKDLEKAGMLEMLRVIREQEPSKPSTKLSTAEGLPTLAANRGTEPAKLTNLVRGELDWIVMKALEKDRNRRYETANGFAMDVQRYLKDEPVLACPPSKAYRLRKFIRRNRGTVALATGLLGMLLFTLMFALYSKAEVDQALADRTKAYHLLELEQKKSDTARLAAEQKTEEIRAGLEKLNAANVLLERGRACIDHPNQPEVRRDGALLAAEAFDKAVALRPDHSMARDVRGHFYCRLGLFEDAAIDLKRAYELRRPPTEVRLDGMSYDLWFRYACLRVWVGDLTGYREVCARMLEHLERSRDPTMSNFWIAKTCGLAPDAVSDLEKPVRVARAMLKWRNVADPGAVPFVLGMAHYRAGQFDKAAEQLNSAQSTPWEPPLVMLGLALTRHRLGEPNAARSLERADNWLDDKLDAGGEPAAFALPMKWWQDWAQLEVLYRETAAAVRGPARADHPTFHLIRARANSMIGRTAQAAEAADRAARLRPEDARVARCVASVRAEAAKDVDYWVSSLTKLANSSDLLRTPLEIARIEELTHKYPASPEYAAAAGRGLHALALRQRKSGDLAGARKSLERAVKHQKNALEKLPENANFRKDLWGHKSLLAYTLLELKDHAATAVLVAETTDARGDWRQRRLVAELLIQCMVLAEKDAKLEETQRQTASQAYAMQAKQALRQARERLAAEHPVPIDGKLIANRTLVIDFNNLAMISLTLGDLPSALECTRAANDWMVVDFVNQFEYIAVRVLAGEVAQYQPHCDRWLETMGHLKTANTPYRLARICALAPDAVSNPGRFEPVARALATAKGKGETAWTMPNKAAIAYYRANKFDDAIKCAHQSIKSNEKWEGVAINWLVLAMARHRQGMNDDARMWFDKATAWINERSTDAPRGSLGPIGKTNAGAWLTCRVLYREAEALIKSEKADVKDR